MSRSEPTAEEAAAIIAAVELVWPRPQAARTPATTDAARWRFAGRWWSKPVPMRRDRPGR